MIALSGSRTEQGIAARMAAAGKPWPPSSTKELPHMEPRREMPVYAAPPVIRFQSRGSTNAKRRLRELCTEHGVKIEDICGPRRWKNLCAARNKIILTLAAEFTKKQLSLNQIGALVGGRDHTTILHIFQKHGCPERGHPMPGETDAGGDA